MKNMPIAIKILLNLFFFIIYLIISVILWSFVFGLVLNIMWKPIPWSHDPVHIKIALVISFVVFLFTSLFRKYFYISFSSLENTEKKIDLTYTGKIKEENDIFMKNEEKQNFIKDKWVDLGDKNNEDMRIYIWKEKNKLK